MKKVSALIVGIIFALSFTSISFAADEILVGTGSSKGFYTTKAFPKIQQQAKAWEVNLKAKPGGSRINIKRLLAGEIQIAMAQFDAVLDADNANLIIIGFMHDEVIHALTTWDHKINEFSDVKKGHKVAIGKPTGGSALTWSVWSGAVKQLADVETVPVQGTRAVAALESGDIDVFFSVTGMGDKYFKQANATKKKYKLVEIDFGALKKLKYKKNPIYNEFEIEEKYYPNLIKGMGDPDVLTVKACLVTTTDWADENEDAYEVIADAVAKARPGIIADSQPKL
jgi:TRAP transporter TAXI family solute receptor